MYHPRLPRTPIFEAAGAGIRFIVAITEGVPVLDRPGSIRTSRSTARGCWAQLSGTAFPGQIESWYPVRPDHDAWAGRRGLALGHAPYDRYQLTQAGIGQTTCIGIGGRPDQWHILHRLPGAFERDPETKPWS